MDRTLTADLFCEHCQIHTAHSFESTIVGRVGREATDTDGRLIRPTPLEPLTRVTDAYWAAAAVSYRCDLCGAIRRYGFESVTAEELAEAKRLTAAA